MQISLEDVMKALHLKSFDYRVLNLLLYQLRDEQVAKNISIFPFFSIFFSFSIFLLINGDLVISITFSLV